MLLRTRAAVLQPALVLGALVLTLFSWGCQGHVDGFSEQSGPAPTPERPGETAPPRVDRDGRFVCEPGGDGLVGSQSALRRLNQHEYMNSVRALLGADMPAVQLLPDNEVEGFPSNAGTLVTDAHLDEYARAAAGFAERADLAGLLPCEVAGGDAACMRTFVEDFGRKAYRRPLEAAEVDSLLALFEVASEGDTFETAARVVIEAMIQSPNFLYLVRLGEAPKPAQHHGPHHR